MHEIANITTDSRRQREREAIRMSHDYSDRGVEISRFSRPNDTPQNLDDATSCSPCAFIRFNGAFAGRPVTPR